MRFTRAFAIASLLGIVGGSACTTFSSEIVILQPSQSSLQERLGVHELRRYFYHRTGELLPIVVSDKIPGGQQVIVLGHKDQPVFETLRSTGLDQDLACLGEQEYLLRTVQKEDSDCVVVCGGDPIGTLYGSYRLAEKLGVRFFLHGDVIPDQQLLPALPDVNEEGKPLFAIRGILPFHDFPEGPDWWDLDDYRAVLAQLPKLRMNFIGLHTYPEGGPNAEPTVWIGLPEDIDEDGTVRSGYPSSYQNTRRGNWGYSSRSPQDFGFGADQLFEGDEHGAQVMSGMMPSPENPEDQILLFNRVGAMLSRAFEFAKDLGVKTCVGTETPLTIPEKLKQKLRRSGKDPNNPAVGRELYEGVFRRISKNYPLDYYWFWTDEDWTWRDVEDSTAATVEADLQSAVAAARDADVPFTLATCGWVLGPPKDRTQFDRLLPKEMPFSCINRQLGKDPVDQSFVRLTGRPKWAIPWMEDDPRMISPQLWVGRMRRDALDALRYECTGLIGIHWRTDIIGPNVLALARAAWDQGDWASQLESNVWSEDEIAVYGGEAKSSLSAIRGTDNARLYQTARTGAQAYRFRVPNGSYKVKLGFAELEHSSPGLRTFKVRLQGNVVVPLLDIFARAGKFTALDLSFPTVRVSDQSLVVDFVPVTGLPTISSIVFEGEGISTKINCGGSARGDYMDDPQARPPIPRHLPADDFFLDWAEHSFGSDTATEIAAVFVSIDGKLHEPSQWIGGPGGISTNTTPWSQVERAYLFLEALEKLRTRIKGRGNLARYDYWLNTFRFMKTSARVGCTLGELELHMAILKEREDLAGRKVYADMEIFPRRERLIRQWEEMVTLQLACLDTKGGLGTIANLEQHSIGKLRLLAKHDDELERLLDAQVSTLEVSREYRGPERIVVPTKRTLFLTGEKFELRVLLLSNSPVNEFSLYWRELGEGPYQKVPVLHKARGVYEVIFPLPDSDFEYYVEAVTESSKLFFPAAAREINHSAIVLE